MKHYPLYTKESLPRDLVLANGAFPTAPTPLALLDRWSLGQEGYTLTCCDGAVNKLRRYTSLLPDAVVGDLDSVSPALRALLGERVHRFPDQDHLLANLALLPSYTTLTEELIMLTDEGYFILVSEPSEIEVIIGQQVSIFNFSQTPVSLTGVRWPLRGDVLPQLWSGSLNCAEEETIRVETHSPILVYLANV